MGALVDRDLSGVSPATPFAQRMRRQLHRRGVGPDAHSAPVHRLYMHRTERPAGTIACVRRDGEAAFLVRFLALFAAHFRTDFREFTCGFFADELLQRAPKRVLDETLLTTIFADPEPLRRYTSTCSDHHSRRALFSKCLGPPGESPQQQRTRNGATMDYRKDVQGPGVYRTTVYCKIKAARLLITKPLTWLGFNGAGRSLRVPRFESLLTISRVFSALLGICACWC
jgi:hypothetical protein